MAASGTLTSTTTPYATAADLILRYDVRQIGNQINDDNTTADAAAIAASPVVESALLDASGDLEAAVLTGGLYTLGNLQRVAFVDGDNPTLTATGHRLKRIVCAIAFWRLWARRHPFDTPDKFPSCVEAFADLEKLAEGVDIFSLAETVDAGLPSTTAWVNPLDDTRYTQQACRFFTN